MAQTPRLEAIFVYESILESSISHGSFITACRIREGGHYAVLSSSNHCNRLTPETPIANTSPFSRLSLGRIDIY